MATTSVLTESQVKTSVQAKVAVVGADGFLGGCIAQALGGDRVVYGACGNGEVHVSQAQRVVERADVVINAGGFRVRPGCRYPDYQRVHQGALSALVPWVRKDALLLHFSSASVLGKSKHQKLGNSAPPDPDSFPSRAYALAKLEADQFLEREAATRDFRVIFLRPAAVYGAQGTGMVDTLLQLAKRGIMLRLHPRNARHHLCYAGLLVEVVRRVIELSSELPHLTPLVIADPYTVMNEELETMLRLYVRKKARTFTVPVGLLASLLQHSFHSRTPRFDLKTWGEILGVMNLDTEYDPSETFRVLGIDAADYSIDRTLRPILQHALEA